MTPLEICFESLTKSAAVADAIGRVAGRAGKAVKNFGLRQAHGFSGSYAGRAAEIGLDPHAVQHGISSLPGIAKGLRSDPKGTAKAMLRHSVGTRWGQVGTALPVALAAPDLIKGDESATGGRSMGQKLTRLGVGVAGGIATGGLPVIPGAVAGLGVDAVAHRLTAPKRKTETTT